MKTAPRGLATSTLLLWIALVVSDTVFQLLMKSAGDALGEPAMTLAWIAEAAASWRTLLAGAAYLAQFGLWMLILRRSSLSFAFPVTAITYVSVLVGSHWFFGDAISTLRWAGVALIVSGVALLRDDEAAPAPSA